MPAVPSEAVENDSEPKTLPSQELPKAIVLKNPVGNLKTEPPTEDTPLWKSFGLLVVFITGLAMIFYYLRVRRRRNQGFQPLNQKEDD